jgi:acyl carrier protein
MDLDAFVLFSSVTTTLGGAGMAGYTAANAFLESLAALRRAAGLPGLALGWGPWGESTGMAGRLSDADLARLARGGAAVMDTGTALRLLDGARAYGLPVVLPFRLSTAALASGGVLPVLSRLVPARRTAAAPTSPGEPLPGRLAGLAAEERTELLRMIVRAEAAAILGLGSPGDVPDEGAFKDLGVTSLTALELRNRLAAATGTALPPTLVFDYPTPAAVSAFLDEEIGAPDPLAELSVELDRIAAVLAALPATDRERGVDRLRVILSGLSADGAAPLTDDEVLQFLDRELGGS